MAKAVDIAAPNNFNPNGDSTGLGQRWKKWVKGFSIYLIAAGISDDEQKRALLLHSAGEDVREIVETLSSDTTTYAALTTALNDYFLPKQNKRYERHVFRQAAQKESETISQYSTRLATLSKACEFNDVND